MVATLVERPAGFYIDNLVPYQVLWYWHLHGQAFSPEAVQAFSSLLEKLPREDSGMDDADAAWTDWRKARNGAYAKLGHPLPVAKAPATPPSQQPPQWDPDRLQAGNTNCFYGDAFRNATQTLSQRMQRAAHDKAAAPFVLNWLQTQDAVFDMCNEKSPAAAPALPANAPAWLKADNAYQMAAQSFYGDALGEADDAFAAIAADKASPWRDLAAYMRLRVLARQNPGKEPSDSDSDSVGKESAEVLKQQAALTKAVDAIAVPLLKNPRLQPLYGSVHRLAEALRIRYLMPGTRLQRLAGQLKVMGPPELAAARLLLLNHEFRYCAISGCAYVGPAQGSDLVAWLSTVRDFAGRASASDPKWRETTSWSSYQRTHELAWLLAAASLVPPATATGDKREAELQDALAAVPEDSPARFAATQLRAQRLYAQGRYKEVREVVAGAADSPLIAHSPSGQNIVKALLLPTADSEAQWRQLAIRPVVARRDPEAMEARPADRSAARPPLATAFDEDVIRFLNTRAPLAMWLRLAQDPALSPALRDTLLETAWTRAVLAEDYATARRAATLRMASKAAAPAALAKGTDPIAGLRRSVALKDTDTAAWHRLLLERMSSPSETLAPPHWPGPDASVLPTPLLLARDPGTDRGMSLGSYGKWCRPLGVMTSGPHAAPASEFETPQFLPADERASQAALVDKLRAIAQDSVYFTQESLALMQRTPADPLVPQALSVAVKMARYTCPDKGVGDWSRKGLQALHANYPQSTWAASTPYWYGGR